jgi:hypothetical protein
MGYRGGADANSAARPDFTRADRCDAQVTSEIEHAFAYHPWMDDQTKRGELVRQALVSAVKVIVASVPPCPDRSAAIRKLREARMDCNSAITHNGRY